MDKPKRKRFSKKPLNKAQVAATAKITRQIINRKLEKKYHDLKFEQVAFSYAGNTLSSAHITATSQGLTDVDNRVGDQITLTSLKGSINIRCADSTQLVRFLLFQYMGDPNLSAPTASMVLQSNALSTVAAPHAPYAKDYVGGKAGKVRILYDTGIINQVSGANNDQVIRKFKILKFPQKTIQYQGSGSTPIKGAIYWMAVADSSAVTHPDITGIIRMRYTDA